MAEVIEHWRAVIGYEGVYEVSCLGRIRRVHTGRVQKTHRDRLGYLWCKLTVLGKGRSFAVHSLVAAAFLGPKPEGCEINHRDRNRSNAEASNLEYLTKLENIQYSRQFGEWPVMHGETNGFSKLTPELVREIRTLRAEGSKLRHLAQKYGVSETTISSVANGHSWRHISQS